MSVLPGIDVLIDERRELMAGRRVGLISGACGVTHNLTSDVDALRHAPDVQLVALFGAEHGFDTAVADGGEIKSTVDSRTGLPVHSLYGEVRKPTSEMLDGIDVLVYDLQGVGVRFYTYITTLLYTMQAAAEHGVSVIVCDRPNPIGGEIVEGPLLKPGFESFVGPGPLPIRHGMTVGELARLYNDAWGVSCDLTVVPCAGWERTMWYDDTGMHWVLASPNIPWPATAEVYPGTCLIEGTNVSEGRGTTLPFHLIGAPWIDGYLWAGTLNKLDLPGIRFRPVVFQPTSRKWVGQRCSGVQLHVSNRRDLSPVTVGLHLLVTLRALYPDQFTWGDTTGRIDRLSGSDVVRQAVDSGMGVDDLVASWADELEQFAQASRQYHLY